MPLLKKKPSPPNPPPPPPLPGAATESTNQIPSSARAKPPVPVKPKALLGISQSDSGRESSPSDDSQTDLDGQVSNVSLNSNSNNSNDSSSDKPGVTDLPTSDLGTPPAEAKKSKGKASKLRRALTSNSLTLSRLSKNKKNKRQSLDDSVGMPSSKDDGAVSMPSSEQGLRDGGLWKLPGMDAKNASPKQPIKLAAASEEKQPIKSATVSVEEKQPIKSPVAQEENQPIRLPVAPVEEKPTAEDLKHRELPPLPSNSEEDVHKSSLTPPTLPARPHPQDSPSGSHDQGKSPPEEKTDNSLQAALDKYSGCYPIRFRVLQGYCNDSSDVNMSTDDVYDIHLVKETKVVSIRGDGGTLHRVPLGTPQKLGIIYNPNNDYTQGLEGYVFKSVADITGATPLPKVVMATQEARSQDGKYLCLEGEVLVVLGVHRTLFKGRRGLKVYSMEGCCEKVLPEDCHAYFTTNPSLVRLHLPEILQLVPTPFPSQAVMYSAGEDLDQPTVRGVVSLVECSSETSLVVSAVAYDENMEPIDQSDSPDLFDLPLDNEMRELEVSVLQFAPQGDQSDCSSCSSDHTYDDTVVVPREAMNVRSQDFVTPEESQVLVGSTFSDIRDFDQDEDDRYDTVGLHLVSPGPGRYGNEDPRLSSWLEDLQGVTRAIEQRVSSLEQRNEKLLSQLSDKLQAVETSLHSIKNQPMELQEAASVVDKSHDQVNRDFLASLSVDQVCQVFEAMGLGGVKGRLHDEQVSGDILLEFDDEILRDELGLSSRIQRIRVMKIISGQHPVQQLLLTE